MYEWEELDCFELTAALKAAGVEPHMAARMTLRRDRIGTRFAINEWLTGKTPPPEPEPEKRRFGWLRRKR